MRGAATSDLHLGFTAFARTISGRNARERDVEVAWDHTVDAIIEAQPDLVTVAGDCLHHTRVSDYAKRALQVGVRRIVNETSAHVVIIPGNHEGSKTAQVLTPIVLADGHERIHIVTQPERLRLRCERTGERIGVTCLPFTALMPETKYATAPDSEVDTNVMLIHAAVRSSEASGAVPFFYAGEQSIDIGKLAELYDVIAAGDFHEFRRLHPTRLAFYSGPIERTSSDIWHEHAAKGVVIYDTTDGSMNLREIPTRNTFDIEADATDAPTLNSFMAELLTRPYLAEAIVRITIEGMPREDKMQIDQALVRQLKSRCFHFQLDVAYRARPQVEVSDRRERAQSGASSVAAFFADDEEAVRECAIGFLGAAGVAA